MGLPCVLLKGRKKEEREKGGGGEGRDERTGRLREKEKMWRNKGTVKRKIKR